VNDAPPGTEPPAAPPPHPHRHHVPQCLNCGADTPGAYCSVCGQEASDYRISTRLFLREVLSIFTLDSKFFRSIGPLLFKPGQLTIAFTQGKRARYLRPLRLYLFTSFLFFVGAGLLLDQRVAQMDPAELADGFMNITFSVDSTGVPVHGNVRDAMRGVMTAMEDFPRVQERLLEVVVGEAVEQGLPDTTAARLLREAYAAHTDSLARLAEGDARRIRERATRADSIAALGADTTRTEAREATPFDDFVNSLADNDGSLIGTGEGEIDPREMLRSFLSNLPTLMFFMVPLFALMLKLLYIRRKRLYIEHLVFGFHTHAFLFIMIGVALVLPFLPGFVWLIVAFAYLMFAAKRVYQQGWWKTYFKVNILLTIYSVVLLIGFVLTLLVSAAFIHMAEQGRTLFGLFS
jgi:hypothetical protein